MFKETWKSMPAKQKRTIYFIGVVVVVIVFLSTLSDMSEQRERNGISSRMNSINSITSSNVAMDSSIGRQEYPLIAPEEGQNYFGMNKSMVPSPIPSPTAGQTAAEVDQRIIKTSSLTLIVKNVPETVSKITSLATGAGGFVQDASTSERPDETKYGSITIRIPVNSFEKTVEDIKGYATLVENASVYGQDVTEQYTDMAARLKNAQAQEQQYLVILAQAKDVEDILAVQRELSNVRQTIEQLQGQIKYLENATSYSTISVSLSEEPSVTTSTTSFDAGRVVKEAVHALVLLGQAIVINLIWFVIVGGSILIPIGLILWIVYRIVRKRGTRK